MNFTRPIRNASLWETHVTSAGELPRSGSGTFALPPIKAQRVPGGNAPVVLTASPSRRIFASRKRGALPTP